MAARRGALLIGFILSTSLISAAGPCRAAAKGIHSMKSERLDQDGQGFHRRRKFFSRSIFRDHLIRGRCEPAKYPVRASRNACIRFGGNRQHVIRN
jgi:hypothetical protein